MQLFASHRGPSASIYQLRSHWETFEPQWGIIKMPVASLQTITSTSSSKRSRPRSSNSNPRIKPSQDGQPTLFGLHHAICSIARVSLTRTSKCGPAGKVLHSSITFVTPSTRRQRTQRPYVLPWIICLSSWLDSPKCRCLGEHDIHKLSSRHPSSTQPYKWRDQKCTERAFSKRSMISYSPSCSIGASTAPRPLSVNSLLSKFNIFHRVVFFMLLK